MPATPLEGEPGGRRVEGLLRALFQEIENLPESANETVAELISDAIRHPESKNAYIKSASALIRHLKKHDHAS